MNAYQMFCDRYFMEPPEKALKDLKGYYPDKIGEKTNQLAELLQLEAVGNSEVHTGNISDMTGKAGLKRIELEQERESLIKMQDAILQAYKSLDDQQKDILDLFYAKGGMISFNIDEYSHNNGLSVRSIYRAKISALEDFKENLKELVNAL